MFNAKRGWRLMRRWLANGGWLVSQPLESPGRTSAGRNDSCYQAFLANVPSVMHEICRSPKHQGSAYTTLPIRIAGIDQSGKPARRSAQLFSHFAFREDLHSDNARPRITKNGGFLCCNVAASH